MTKTSVNKKKPKWFPDEFLESAYDIDYRKMYELGYRGIIYDIDNTLVPHDADADDRARCLFENLKSLGFGCILISNNHEDRVRRFNKDMDIPYVFDALKPSAAGYLAAGEKLGLSPDKIFCVGDQIFTDVWGAGRAGMYMIMVKPFDRAEPPFVRFKRILEKPVLTAYRLYRKKGSFCPFSPNDGAVSKKQLK